LFEIQYFKNLQSYEAMQGLVSLIQVL